jgi:hypothetical protein
LSLKFSDSFARLYDTGVLAHQGGWDEILLVAAPIAVIVLVLWQATRRAERQQHSGPACDTGLAHSAMRPCFQMQAGKDEPALIAALREGRILSAGLDVFAGEPEVPAELVAMDHVVLLPHVGSASHATRDAMSALVVDNAVSFAAGRGPLTPVAETPWPLHAKTAN